jgi:hypothetical protein
VAYSWSTSGTTSRSVKVFRRNRTKNPLLDKFEELLNKRRTNPRGIRLEQEPLEESAVCRVNVPIVNRTSTVGQHMGDCWTGAVDNDIRAVGDGGATWDGTGAGRAVERMVFAEDRGYIFSLNQHSDPFIQTQVGREEPMGLPWCFLGLMHVARFRLADNSFLRDGRRVGLTVTVSRWQSTGLLALSLDSLGGTGGFGLRC